MDWLTGLFTLLGVGLGLGYSEYKNYRERKERFQVISFEKRLQVHQNALSRIYKLDHAINNSKLSFDDKNKEIVQNEENNNY